MSAENAQAKNIDKNVEELLGSEVYKENLEFWDRAWSPVKAPYTQLPDLNYLPWIPEYLAQRGARRILDLGCGSGWLSIYLARRGFEITGIDISPHAIRLACAWAEQDKLSIGFQTGDIAKMHYTENTFDAVVANSIFEHLTHDLAVCAIDSIRRFLAADGCFVGCFDKVGGGPGEYYELADGSHIYTDKGRRGMLLRYFSDEELKELFHHWTIDRFEILDNGSRFVCAHL